MSSNTILDFSFFDDDGTEQPVKVETSYRIDYDTWGADRDGNRDAGTLSITIFEIDLINGPSALFDMITDDMVRDAIYESL
jgi:hypothetical protein